MTYKQLLDMVDVVIADGTIEGKLSLSISFKSPMFTYTDGSIVEDNKAIEEMKMFIVGSLAEAFEK